jgi:hypothetical protein
VKVLKTERKGKHLNYNIENVPLDEWEPEQLSQYSEGLWPG